MEERDTALEANAKNINDETHLRASAILIISLTLSILCILGVLFAMLVLPKNGFKTETLENGEEISYMYVNGKKQTGWHIVDWNLHYFSTEDGHMIRGKYVIDGIEYYFLPEDGKLAVNRTVTHEDGTTVRYDSHGKPTVITPGLVTESDGTTALYGQSGKLYGWQTVNGITYYFQQTTGRMLKNEAAYIDGKYYSFDEKGIGTEISEK